MLADDNYHRSPQQQQQQGRPKLQSRRAFVKQRLGNPFEGQYTGLAVADLNGDGAPDILVSAGKHWIDQPYVLMNLGHPWTGRVIFSRPLPLGPPGGYYQVDVSKLSFLDDGHVGVLLAGGVCSNEWVNRFGACTATETTRARLLDVQVTGCLLHQGCRQPSCQLSWSIIWQDGRLPVANSGGDRNGAFSHELGNGVDPAIVLVGVYGAVVFAPPYNEWNPDFSLSTQDKSPYHAHDPINRGTGLAVGSIGTKYVGFFIGTRTRDSAPPAPIVGVWQTQVGPPAEYGWYSLSDTTTGGVRHDAYRGNPQGKVAVQATNLVLADLNGDSILDVIEANHVDEDDLQLGFPVQQDYYLLDEEGFAMDDGGVAHSFSWEEEGARSVHAGNLFADSGLPDVALGTGDGQVVLFANLGNDNNAGAFRGLQERHRFRVAEPGCQVRDIKIVPAMARPCAPSIVAAVYCENPAAGTGGVFAFHDAVTTC